MILGGEIRKSRPSLSRKKRNGSLLFWRWLTSGQPKPCRDVTGSRRHVFAESSLKQSTFRLQCWINYMVYLVEIYRLIFCNLDLESIFRYK